MPETTDTQRPFSFPQEGEHILHILEIPTKQRTKSGDGIVYKFTFGYLEKGQKKKWTAFFMPWDLGPILGALRFKKISEHSYEWEREECKGRTLKATVKHQADKNDPAKVWPRIEKAIELTSDGDAIQPEPEAVPQEEISF